MEKVLLYLADQMPVAVVLLIVIIFLLRQNAKLSDGFLAQTKVVSKLSVLIKAMFYQRMGREPDDDRT